jgi:hypothetical protein
MERSVSSSPLPATAEILRRRDQCFGHESLRLAHASRRAWIGTNSWLSTSFGGSLKRRPATWPQRRAVGHAEEDEDIGLLFF